MKNAKDYLKINKRGELVSKYRKRLKETGLSSSSSVSYSSSPSKSSSPSTSSPIY